MTWHLAPFSSRPLVRTGSDPFSSLQRELNRAFDDLWRAPALQEAVSFTSLRLDVKEDEKAFHVMADLPGMAEKEVEVTFEEGVLTVRGEKKVERDEKKDTWHITERSSGSFARQIALPGKIDAEKISAKFEKGVLSIDLPKQPEAQSKTKKIEIKSQ